MSRAGIKKNQKPAAKHRVATNLTISPDLRDWGVAHAKKLGFSKASLSELINRLVSRDEAAKCWRILDAVAARLCPIVKDGVTK